MFASWKLKMLIQMKPTTNISTSMEEWKRDATDLAIKVDMNTKGLICLRSSAAAYKGEGMTGWTVLLFLFLTMFSDSEGKEHQAANGSSKIERSAKTFSFSYLYRSCLVIRTSRRWSILATTLLPALSSLLPLYFENHRCYCRIYSHFFLFIFLHLHANLPGCSSSSLNRDFRFSIFGVRLNEGLITNNTIMFLTFDAVGIVSQYSQYIGKHRINSAQNTLSSIKADELIKASKFTLSV